ncbi:hypothetical protein BDZ45DRAFT_607871, partial [Acephala macrosclerotiorum]
IIIVTLESTINKTFETFLNRLQELYQLDRFVFDEYHTILNNTTEFRLKMRQLNELIKRKMQIIYLTTILPLYIEPEFINIIKIRVEDIHMFQVFINRFNIAYSVAKYEKNKFKKKNIIVVCRLIE